MKKLLCLLFLSLSALLYAFGGGILGDRGE